MPLMGHNTNLRHAATLYHVQTEDLGPERALIETVIFVDGGRVLDSWREPYPEERGGVENETKLIRILMKSQHKRALLAVRDGDYDTPADVPRADADASGSAAFQRSVRVLAGGRRFDPSGRVEGEPVTSLEASELWRRLRRVRR